MVKGAVYTGTDVVVQELGERPTECGPRDALVEVTLCAVCTSDLHIRRGAVPRARAGTVLGHEFVGVVRALGAEAAARNAALAVGTRVAANCITFCGDCYYCRRGFINNCERGGWELGCRIDGAQQGGLVRVPFADTGLAPIPAAVSDEQALFVGDVLASGYFAVAELGGVRAGDCVAVVGAGPVGLCAMLCARLRGARTVVALDVDPHRLAVARAHAGADLCINPDDCTATADGTADGTPEAQIARINDGRGADCVVEAAGTDAAFQLAWRAARPNGTVALVAMYEAPPRFPLPDMYGKNLCWRTGGVDAVHSAELLQHIAAGRLDTRFLVTHRGTLDTLPALYDTLARAHETRCLKCVATVRAPAPVPAALARLQHAEDARRAAHAARAHDHALAPDAALDAAFAQLAADARAAAGDAARTADVLARMRACLAAHRLAVAPCTANRAQRAIDSLAAQLQALGGSGSGAPTASFSFSCPLVDDSSSSPSSSVVETTTATEQEQQQPQKQQPQQTAAPQKGKNVVLRGCGGGACRSTTVADFDGHRVYSAWDAASGPMTLRVLRCTHTVFALAPVAGSVYAEDCCDCVLSVVAHQIRLKNCHRCRVQFVCRSVPVLEACTDIRVAPFVLAGDSAARPALQRLVAAYGVGSDLAALNCGTDVRDFMWLAPTTPSPNWSHVEPEPVVLDVPSTHP